MMHHGLDAQAFRANATPAPGTSFANLSSLYFPHSLKSESPSGGKNTTSAGTSGSGSSSSSGNGSNSGAGAGPRKQLRTKAPMNLYSYEFGEQGVRPSMEDEHVHGVLDAALFPHIALYAVLDGHGGIECATFVKAELFSRLSRRLHDALMRSTDPSQTCPSGGDLPFPSVLSARVNLLPLPSAQSAVTQALLEIDMAWLKKMKGSDIRSQRANSGATAAIVLIDTVHGEVLSANLGDARSLLNRGAQAVELTKIHQPQMMEERARIEAAGGSVVSNRINGVLAVARAFGDRMFKSTSIAAEETYRYPSVDTSCKDLDQTSPAAFACCAVPALSVTRLQPQDKFLIIACDGLFDVLTPQEAVDFVQNRLKTVRFQTAYLGPRGRQQAAASAAQHVVSSAAFSPPSERKDPTSPPPRQHLTPTSPTQPQPPGSSVGNLRLSSALASNNGRASTNLHASNAGLRLSSAVPGGITSPTGGYAGPNEWSGPAQIVDFSDVPVSDVLGTAEECDLATYVTENGKAALIQE